MISRVTYKPMMVNRPIVIKRGWPGEIEKGLVQAFLGEWVVFKLPLESGNNAEFRMPIDDALAEGLVTAVPDGFYDEEDELE